MQLREVGQKLSGTASQFNIYWDSKVSQAVIEPGAVYTRNAPEAANYNDKDVTWFGTASEYKKTLAAFFDAGLRKVPVGDLAVDGSLTNVKYGLVDSNGVWVAQPIYNDIRAEYYCGSAGGEILRYIAYDEKSAESIFVDGYVQATRGGKMGLLDSKGKDVIPCKYDAVGLPVEGISRLIVGSTDKDALGYPKKYYIGYWSLEQGKEIVAPNKYVLYDPKDTVASGYPIITAGAYYKYVSDTRVAVRFDFNGGYDPDHNRFNISAGTGIIGGTVSKAVGNSLFALFDVASGKQLTPTYSLLRSLGRGLFTTGYGDYYGPDGKIVFPRAEKVTLNDRGICGNASYVGEDLTGRCIRLPMTAPTSASHPLRAEIS